MRAVNLGVDGPKVSRFGFGTGAISGGYRPVAREDGVATLGAALDAGITLVDGGDFYGGGRGELMTAEALRGRRREDVVLSVKYGARLGIDGVWRGHDTSPAATKAAIAYSLTRLGTDYIDVYRPARIEPDIPVEETVGAVGDLVDQGYVRHIALSEVGPETLRRACIERPIVDVQLEYSLLYRGIEQSMLPVCRELGVSVTAFAILSRGLLSGAWTADRPLKQDTRRDSPRFQGQNLEHNLALVEALGRFARSRGVTLSRLATAWVAAQGDDIVPLLGARNASQLTEAVGAGDLQLTDADLAEIERIVPSGAAAGDRYPGAVLAHLDDALH